MKADSAKNSVEVGSRHVDVRAESKIVEAARNGHVDLVVVCYLQPDGRLVLGAGPVLNYYEFKHPVRDRLTDEKWRQLLESPDAPSRPVWVKNFFRK